MIERTTRGVCPFSFHREIARFHNEVLQTEQRRFGYCCNERSTLLIIVAPRERSNYFIVSGQKYFDDVTVATQKVCYLLRRHPRASESIFLISGGPLLVGFVDTTGEFPS